MPLELPKDCPAISPRIRAQAEELAKVLTVKLSRWERTNDWVAEIHHPRFEQPGRAYGRSPDVALGRILAVAARIQW